jgi:hypothetical protein
MVPFHFIFCISIDDTPTLEVLLFITPFALYKHSCDSLKRPLSPLHVALSLLLRGRPALSVCEMITSQSLFCERDCFRLKVLEYECKTLGGGSTCTLI